MRPRDPGFTLLEVMVAVFVLAVVLGALITLVSENLSALGGARRELAAVELARQRATALLEATEAGLSPEPGMRSGRFDPPDDDLLWEEIVEPIVLPLPETWTGSPSPSVLFEQPVTGEPPAVYRAVVRAFAEGEDPESAPHFVVLLVEPALPLEVPVETPEAVPGAPESR